MERLDIVKAGELGRIKDGIPVDPAYDYYISQEVFDSFTPEQQAACRDADVQVRQWLPSRDEDGDMIYWRVSPLYYIPSLHADGM